MQPRHDQHIGRRRKAAERIVRHNLGVERRVGRHFAIIFKVRAALVENRHRVAQVFQPLARRIAIGRIGQERDARFVPEPPRHGSGFGGDMGKVLGRGTLVDRRIRKEHGNVFADHHVDAERHLIGLGIDHLPHFAHCLGKRPGEARNHRITMAECQQRRGKNVAVLIDHAFNVTFKEPAPLQPLIKMLDHRRDVRRAGG